jgi:hypothetical protein
MSDHENAAQDIVKTIAGNAPDDIKRFLGNFSDMLHRKGNFEDREAPPRKANFFGEDIMKRMAVKEVSIIQKAEEPLKMEGRVVCEMTVDEGKHSSLFLQWGVAVVRLLFCTNFTKKHAC